MSVQPRSNNRARVRVRYRILTSHSPVAPAPATVAAGRASTSEAPGQAGRPPGEPAPHAGDQDRRDDVIVGHWVNGYVSVHAPGELCGLCASAKGSARSSVPGR
jgi:hypothetical protein